MILDPLYLVVLGVGFLLSLGAQLWVKSAVGRWEDVPLSNGRTGRDIAEQILRAAGISNVRVESVSGFLTDHYDPSDKVLRLSEKNYHGRSVAAAGIAAHEAGHAIQDKEEYGPMFIRQKMVPVANIGTNLGMILVFLGLAVGALGLAKIGALLFGGFVVFTLVTLPVEFDASARAKRCLDSMGLVTGEESEGVQKILTAAAATYVAAAVTAILQLLYLLFRSGLLGSRD